MVSIRSKSVLICGLVPLFVAGCSEAPTSQTDLAQYLKSEPVPKILAARFIARSFASRCDGLALAPNVEADVSALRETRAKEFAKVSSGNVGRAAFELSDAFDVQYGGQFNLTTTRGKYPQETCRAGAQEADRDTLIGVMIQRG